MINKNGAKAASKRRRKTHWCSSVLGVHHKRPCLVKWPKATT